MTEPPAPDPRRPEGSADARDPQIAEWLAVEPLDEVTRARLVRDALADAGTGDPARPDRGGTGRRARWAVAASVAAALLVVLAIGLALLVPRGRDTTPTAADAPAQESDGRARGPAEDTTGLAAPDTAPSPDGAATLALPSIGDLGDVSTAVLLERAVQPRLLTPSGAAIPLTGCAVSAARALGTPIGTGTGTIDGEPAVVIVVDQPTGATAVLAVPGPSCDRVVSVVLP